MSQLTSHVEYLSKEIGPRPAGTEEEQRAALYITEQFQKETGFATAVEEFSSSSNVDAGHAVLAAVPVVATVLAMIFPVLAIPAFILAAAAAVIYSLELFDRPVISRFLSRGASQNVVAKYQPNPDAAPATATGRRAARTRKVILVAHYDTGKVTPPLVGRLESSGVPVALVCVAGVVAAAFFLLLRIFIAPGGGMGLLVLNVLSIVAVVICLVPIVKMLLMRSAPYNEGAVNNASGVAALLEIARRIARGSVSEADLVELAEGDVSIHGEAAAREAGLIPEGVQIEYEAEQLTPPSELGDYSEEERLLSAKAAISALTGQPVERRVFGSVADKLVNSRAGELPADAADVLSGAPAPAVAPELREGGEAAFSAEPAIAPSADGASLSQVAEYADAEGFENAPSWFVVAQQNAKRAERFNADEAPQIKRSRYTEAIEHAERERLAIEQEMRAAAEAERAAELKAREEEARVALAAPAEPVAAEPAPSDVPNVIAVPDPAEGPAADASGAAADDPKGPSGTVAMPLPVPAAEVLAEADVEPEPEFTAQERIVALPSIDPASPSSPEPVASPSRSGILRTLRANIPSLSGAIFPTRTPSNGSSTAQADREAARRAIASVPDITREPARQPAAQQPAARAAVQPDLVPAVSASDASSPASAASGSAAAGAPSGEASAPAPSRRDPVEVPRSRSGNLLNRLRKGGDDDLAGTPQQWLDVDDDFEARAAGRARGSWESFRDDQYFDDDDGFGEFSSGDDDRPSRRRWQGGAYSPRMQLGYADVTSEGVQDVPVEFVPAPDASDEGQAVNEEIEQIYHFRNPQFDTEIWFVAMGADGECHDGVRAFMEEHADELRGSMIIEIESLGAGTLSVASEEGRVRKVQASSRVKRYTRDATAATGISPDTVSLAGTDSIASTAQKAGYQTMHLFGAENGRPALKGSADDVFENIDEMLLDEHLEFVFELLKR